MKKLTLLLSLSILFFVIPLTSLGQTSDSLPLGFSVEPRFPKNQINKDIDYYYLLLKPNEQQKVLMDLTNTSSEKKTIDISLHSAKTNSNGVVEYGDSKIKNDDSLKNDFTHIVSGPSSVELNPQEKKTIELTIKMPKKQFDGVVSGGIQFMERNQNRKDQSNNRKEGSVIFNEYVYIYTMVLKETEVQVEPKLIFKGIEYLDNKLYVSYSNVAATYLYHMDVDIKISKKGYTTALYEKKQSNMKMAPNSNITIPVEILDNYLDSGIYTASISVKNQDGIEEKWHEDFEVDKGLVKLLGDSNSTSSRHKKKSHTLLYLLLFFISMVILIVFFIFKRMVKMNSKTFLKNSSKKRKGK